MTSRGPMSDACIPYLPMIGSRPGELEPAESHALETHLAGCPSCRAWAAELASTEWLVSEALMGAAAQRDFAPFVDGVMARVQAGAPRPGLLARLAAAVRLHPRLAIGGALVPAAALAVALYLAAPRNDVASASMLEVHAEGGATTIIQSSDGPVVLLDDDDADA